MLGAATEAGVSAVQAVLRPPRCPACERLLPSALVERCPACRSFLGAGYPAQQEGREAKRPLVVTIVAGWFHLLAGAMWLVTVVAVGYCGWRLTRDATMLMSFDGIAVGAVLGFAVGYFLRRIAAELAEGEPSARAKAFVIFVLRDAVSRWPRSAVVAIAPQLQLLATRTDEDPADLEALSLLATHGLAERA